MAKLLANSGDPDQTPHSAASDLGLHCLPITLLQVSHYNGLTLEWKNRWSYHESPKSDQTKISVWSLK